MGGLRLSSFAPHSWRFLASALLFLWPQTTSAQYRIESWTTDNGLPQNSVRSILQTRDGYLTYVTSSITNIVPVIDTATNTVTATIAVGDGPIGIAFPTRGPVDPIASLIAEVLALVANGTLTQDQGNGVIDKLEQVVAKLDADQTGAACNQLDAFINQINAFVSGGALTPAQGQALVEAVNALKTNLGC